MTVIKYSCLSPTLPSYFYLVGTLGVLRFPSFCSLSFLRFPPCSHTGPSWLTFVDSSTFSNLLFQSAVLSSSGISTWFPSVISLCWYSSFAEKLLSWFHVFVHFPLAPDHIKSLSIESNAWRSSGEFPSATSSHYVGGTLCCFVTHNFLLKTEHLLLKDRDVFRGMQHQVMLSLWGSWSLSIQGQTTQLLLHLSCIRHIPSRMWSHTYFMWRIIRS